MSSSTAYANANGWAKYYCGDDSYKSYASMYDNSGGWKPGGQAYENCVNAYTKALIPYFTNYPNDTTLINSLDNCLNGAHDEDGVNQCFCTGDFKAPCPPTNTNPM
jgi:hypothetical protein